MRQAYSALMFYLAQKTVHALSKALHTLMLFLLTQTAIPSASAISEEELLDADIAFAVLADQYDANTIRVEFGIADGYYLYRHKLGFLSETNGINLGAAVLPDGDKHSDEFFGEVETYRNQLIIDIPFTVTDKNIKRLQLQIQSQGCADIGVCYPPQLRSIPVPIKIDAINTIVRAENLNQTTNGIEADTLQNSTPVSEQDEFTNTLTGGRTLLIVLSFFGVGLLLAFTPCVFPMIPILSGIIAGQGENITTRKAFTLSLTYVLAMAITYTIAGVLVGLSGENIQALFQNAWVLGAFAMVFVALAFAMFGFYELQMPTSIQSQLVKLSNNQDTGSLLGTGIMGFLSALIIGPCVTAPLIGALIYIADSGDAVLGGLALFALSMGMGAPLILIGTSAGKIMPKAGAWMETVKHVFGVMMLFLAVWLVERVLPISITMVLYGTLLIGAAIYMGAVESIKDHHSRWYKLWKAIGMVALLYGALLIIGAVSGGNSLLQPLKGILAASNAAVKTEVTLFESIKGIAGLEAALAKAEKNQKPVMLDFYADWCMSCKEMEAFTFSNIDVKKTLGAFTLAQSDVTLNDEQDKTLMKTLGIFGPPAILFYSPDHQELRQYRVVGYKNADDFNQHLQKILIEIQ